MYIQLTDIEGSGVVVGAHREREREREREDQNYF